MRQTRSHRNCYCNIFPKPLSKGRAEYMRLEPYNELLTEGYFLDVGNNIQAHQIVLGSLSEDLPAAIHSFEGKIQECLIKFAYTGQLDVEMTTIGSLLKIATQYDIHPLKRILAHYLITNLSLDNAVATFNMSLDHLCQRHIFTIKSFILHHFHAIQRTKSFDDLSFEALEDMVKHNKLALKEEELFNSIIAWTDANDDYKHLLRHVRYQLMDKSFYDNTVLNCPLVHQDSQVLKMVNNKRLKRVKY